MYRLVDNPFENSTLKEELEAVIKAQERAMAMGGFLVTEYDQHFLPQLDKLAGVKRSGYRSSRNDGLIYGWICDGTRRSSLCSRTKFAKTPCSCGWRSPNGGSNRQASRPTSRI